MIRLEKDFSVLKKEEQEEQVEMRVSIADCILTTGSRPWTDSFFIFFFLKRLRAENKLLKQRIDNLEKVNSSSWLDVLRYFRSLFWPFLGTVAHLFFVWLKTLVPN